MRPKILLYLDAYEERAYQSLSYIDFFSRYGEVILVRPENDLNAWINEADILALPGGADVNPGRYGEKPHSRTGRLNPHYECLDMQLLTPWLETGKPIIGICRGLQALNVAAGGTLHQHVQGHNLFGKKGDRSDPTQTLNTDLVITVDDDTEFDFHVAEVNSFHHQAIAKLAPGFEMLGWGHVYNGCPSLDKERRFQPTYLEVWDKNKLESKIVREGKGKSKYAVLPEIIRHTSMPWIAFQYHPEELNDDLSHLLIWDTLKRAGIHGCPFKSIEIKVKPIE